MRVREALPLQRCAEVPVALHESLPYEDGITPRGMREENTNAIRGVIIPSYNSGPLLLQTVLSVLEVCAEVIVTIDGSTDGSDRGLEGLGGGRVRVVRLLKNSGKGAAFLEAARLALSLGWSHAAVVDADGQHAVSDIPRFFALSRRYPGAMVLGQPVFGDDAPWVRVVWRRVGNWLTRLETLWGWAGDSLFGFRVYPLEATRNWWCDCTGRGGGR